MTFSTECVCLCHFLLLLGRLFVCFPFFVPLNVVVGSTVLSACLLNKSAPLIAGQSVTVSGKKYGKTC